MIVLKKIKIKYLKKMLVMIWLQEKGRESYSICKFQFY